MSIPKVLLHFLYSLNIDCVSPTNRNDNVLRIVSCIYCCDQHDNSLCMAEKVKVTCIHIRTAIEKVRFMSIREKLEEREREISGLDKWAKYYACILGVGFFFLK